MCWLYHAGNLKTTYCKEASNVSLKYYRKLRCISRESFIHRDYYVKNTECDLRHNWINGWRVSYSSIAVNPLWFTRWFIHWWFTWWVWHTLIAAGQRPADVRRMYFAFPINLNLYTYNHHQHPIIRQASPYDAASELSIYFLS